MTETLTIEPVARTVVVRAGGAVIAESAHAMALREAGYPPVYYLPRSDIAMAFLEPSERTSRCPHKGQASYFHIAAKSGLIRDAAWSYETPLPGAEAIREMISFYTDKAFVELI